MKITVKNYSSLTDGTPPALWAEVFYNVEQSIADLTKEIEIAKNRGPWRPDESNICMERDGDGLFIKLSLWDEDEDRCVTFASDIALFLDETEEIYSCGDSGWEDELLEDLETLKAAIQERIDRITP